ncbi:MAG: hypothetical protein NTZ78_04160 [Candidatus Aureabacteria bacterium]|nr:hypothetical protein [Candidatus Auribacterota bacterium]
MASHTEDISHILGLREQAPGDTAQHRKLSRLAIISCVLGVTAPLSLGLLHLASQMASELLVLLPLAVSGAAVLLSVAAIIRIAFSRGHKKGIVMALIGFFLGGATMTIYMIALAKAVEGMLRWDAW